jgi:hypothetical protein
MMVYESARFCGAISTYWPPDATTTKLTPYSNHSYFRIRNLETGAVVGNVQGSEKFAYGSAVVDPVTRRAWVFGSYRDLCRKDPNPPADTNFVRAWWSDDLVTWHTTKEPTLRLSSPPLNTDVTPVVNFVSSKGSPLPNGTVDFVMIMDHGRAFYHATGDRNLSAGWQPINTSVPMGYGACPSVHYAEEDGFFYMISGGHLIALVRTRDFLTWESGNAHFIKADADQDTRVSPFMGIQGQVNGSVPGSDKSASASLRSTLAHPYCWEYDVNDADFCCGGPKTSPGAPQDKAFLFYSPSSQGKPARSNCSSVKPKMASTNFNAIATADVSLAELLQSQFALHA